ncbi:Alpha/Beta hydrolase protein [Auriculariales sp. MPI-PUGE-AT-0066]|nr:Alpha/Beta hydrolase protein [Auriculariales sp. MPI-PUGE-AT-0066]
MNSRPRTPVTDRLSALVGDQIASSPSHSRPSSPLPSPGAIPDDMSQTSSSRRASAVFSKSFSAASISRTIVSPAPAVIRNATAPESHTVDAESLPAALSAALLDEDAFAQQRQQIDNAPHRPVNLAEHRMPKSFLSLPSLTGSPYLDGLARISLPSVRAANFVSGMTTPKREEPAQQLLLESTRPTQILGSATPTKALEQLRLIASRSNSVASERGLHTTAAATTSVSSPTRWWFTSENKKHVDKLLDEHDRADTIEHEEEHIRKKYATTKCPVVFCHGLLGFDKVSLGPLPVQISHWRGIQEVLQANGVETFLTRVPGTSSPADRAKVLATRIEEVYPGREVHLIGHSMGGLDCRYLTSQLLTGEKGAYTFKVRSVTTIGTPHRGSAFADTFIEKIGGLDRIPSVLSWLDMLPIGGGDGAAFSSLTPENMRQFNELVLDAPGVQYFSWGAIAEPGFLDAFKYSHGVILEKEGPNDGLVSVESAKWGVYLGTLENVNHLDLIGWLAPFKFGLNFKPGTFYLGICDYLARTVEKQMIDDQQPKLEEPATQAEAGVTTEHRSSSDEAAVTELASSSRQPAEISSEDIAAENIAQASGVSLVDPELILARVTPTANHRASSEDIADQDVGNQTTRTPS